MPREIQIEVAYFIGHVYQSRGDKSQEVLSLFMACKGYKMYVNFLALSFKENQDLIMLSIDAFL